MADDFEEFDDSEVIVVCDEFCNNDNVCRDFEPLGFSDFGLVDPFGFGLVDDFGDDDNLEDFLFDDSNDLSKS